MKVYKFEFGGMFMFFSGQNIGEAIAQMVHMYPERLRELESITEEAPSL